MSGLRPSAPSATRWSRRCSTSRSDRACILLFYAYPAIVTAIECVRGRAHLTPATVTALTLSAAGAVVVVAVGRDVSISVAGIVLALAAATAYAVYLVIGRDAGRRTDAMTTACWVAVGAAASSGLRGLLQAHCRCPVAI